MANGEGGEGPGPGTDLSVLATQLEFQEGIQKAKLLELEFSSDIFAIEEQRLKNLGMMYGTGKSLLENSENELDLARQKVDAQQSYLRSLIKQKEEAEKAFGAASEEVELIREKIDLAKQEIGILNARNKAMEASLASAKNTASAYGDMLGIGNKWERTVVGGMVKARLEGASFSQILKDQANAMAAQFTPMNILGGLVMKLKQGFIALTAVLIQQLTALDKAGASYIKSTQDLSNMRETISKTRDEMIKFGVTFDDASKAAAGLFKNFNEFYQISGALRDELVGFTAENAKLGITADQTGKYFDVMTKALGYNATSAMRVSKELNDLATRIGRSFEQVTSDFVAASGKLAVYGDDAVQIFANLERQSKETGIAVTDLMSVFGGTLDTFKGSAEAAGRLNAILGGQLFNAVELLYASEDERVALIAQKLKLQGMEFDQMSKFQKLSVMQALGIKDVATASRLLRAETGDLTREEQLQAQSEETRQKLLSKSLPLMERMKNALLGLISNLEPAVFWIEKQVEAFEKGEGVFATVADTFKWISENTQLIINTIVGLKVIGIIGTLATTFTALSTAMAAAGSASLLAGGMLGVVALAVAGIAAAMMIFSPSLLVITMFGFAAALYAVGAAANVNKANMFALGGALVLIGGAIGIASMGIAHLAETMKGMTGPEMLMLGAIFGGMAIGIGLLATASVGAALPLLGLGAALVLIGGAIALAGLGIKMALEPFSEMLQYVNAETAGAMYLMAGGVGLLALSMGALATSLAFIKTDDLKAIAAMLSGIAAFSGAKIKVAVDGVEQLVDKTIMLAKNPEGVESVVTLVNQAARYKQIVEKQVIITPAAAASSPARALPPVQVNVMLDRDQIGQAMVRWDRRNKKVTREGF